jgi:uncharacterized protein (TIGR03437 family)
MTMLRRLLLCLAMLSIAGAAATPAFLLGVDYSEWTVPNGASQIATDSSGAIYILNGYVTKLSADGSAIEWENGLGFTAGAMAVDPHGGVYVALSPYTGSAHYVAKLRGDGAGLAWAVSLNLPYQVGEAMAADPQGRAYVAVASGNQGSVFRIKADGSGIDYTAQVSGAPGSIAVDPSGTAYVAGAVPVPTGTGGFVAQLKPDGSAGYSVSLPVGLVSPAIALDANGNAVAFGNGTLVRLDSTGAVTLSTPVPMGGGGLALDAGGNAYVTGGSKQLYRTTGSIAVCASTWAGYFLTPPLGQQVALSVASVLTVVAPDGSILQSTYLPGTNGGALLATGPNSTVYVVANPDGSAPTRAGPFQGQEGQILLRLSPNPSAPTIALVCIGNPSTYNIEPVAPGEIVTLFGNGIGPQNGIATEATIENPFPTQAGNVELTFDGVPAPLLWVQGTQINAVVPWSVAGPVTKICVAYNNAQTNCLNWGVAEAAPTVFTVDGIAAAALNQDGTVNSATNPAPLNSIVSIFATGLGPINPPQADGSLVVSPLPVNVLPVKLEVGFWTTEPPFGGMGCCAWKTYDPAYAGPAAFLVAGASQINLNTSELAGAYDIHLTLPTVQTTNGPASSNNFGIYLASQ